MFHRRCFALSILVLFFGAGPAALSGVDKKTAFRIEKLIKTFHKEIIQTRRFIHMNPELSNREYETSKLLASKMIAQGLDIKTGVAKTGVVGLLRGDQSGITIALRADMDALPIREMTDLPYKSLNDGVMHACGHDVHSAVVLGAALVLSRMKDRIPGNIKFIFQPAEEGAPSDESGGAKDMIEAGVLEDPPVRAIFGLHVWPDEVGTILYSPGDIMASSDWFEIVIKGKSAHAAKPEEGIDAINLSAQVVTGIQSIISRTVSPSDPAVVTIGKIQGGTRPNILAQEVRLEGTVRTLNEETRRHIQNQIESITSGITRAFGADFDFTYLRGAPPVYNHPDLGSIMLPALIEVIGRANLKPLPPQLVAEDFSYFSQAIPGFYFFLGVRPPGQETMPPLHNPRFNPDERSIPLGIKLLCHLILDCLDHESELNQDSPARHPS